MLRVVATYLEGLRAKATRNTLTEQGALANAMYVLAHARPRKPRRFRRTGREPGDRELNAIEHMRQEAEQNYVVARLNLKVSNWTPCATW